MRIPVGPAAAALIVLLTGCGTAVGPDGSGAEADWSSTAVPGRAGPDSPTILAVDGDDLLVMTTSDDGVLRSSLSRDGAPFETGERRTTGRDFLALGGAAPLADGWFALGSGGLGMVDGDEELLFEPVGLRSADGLAWEQVPVTGVSAPADIAAVTRVDQGLVAAGSLRGAEDPSMGGFRAVAWHSQDGSTWTEVPLPNGGGESYVADLATVDGSLLAVGGADDAGAVWTSSDDGASWVRSTAPALAGSYAVTGVAAQDGVAVASITAAEGGSAGLLRSEDGGRTWTAASGPPASQDAEGFAPVWAGGGRFYTVTSSFLEWWESPAVCYADIARCQADSTVTLHASSDGVRWRAVDTSGIDSGEGDEVDQVTGTADGRTVALQVRADDVLLHTWPAGSELPLSAASAPPDPPELVEVPRDGKPEPGVRYHAPLYVHCGMDWLYLGDRAWRRSDEGPDLETGAGDEVDTSWPLAQQTIFGFATLTDDGVVEYSIGDGEVIAVYARTDKQPPGCD